MKGAAPSLRSGPTTAATPRTRLLLAPSTNLAQPRGWAALANSPSLICKSVPFSQTRATVDEVHCVGGGSLLLWLLACAGRAPRGRMVYMHGPVVLPTPESCAEWLARDCAAAVAADDDNSLSAALFHVDNSLSSDDWRTQAVMAGLGGGGLPLEHTAWLRPLLTAVACGRADELGARFSSMQRRWERIGRLVHLPMPETEDGLLDELLRQQMEATSTAKGSAPSTLLRCGEMGCAAVAAPPPVVPQPPPARKDDVVFLCAPVGWQHVNMGRALFEENAVFNRVVRECERIAERDQLLPRPLLDVLYPSAEDGLDLEAADALLQTPTFTMP